MWCQNHDLSFIKFSKHIILNNFIKYKWLDKVAHLGTKLLLYSHLCFLSNVLFISANKYLRGFLPNFGSKLPLEVAKQTNFLFIKLSKASGKTLATFCLSNNKNNPVKVFNNLAIYLFTLKDFNTKTLSVY